ncbi:MAG: AraC family transcriptional regulator [Pyrinomonadaceae bacterium]
MDETKAKRAKQRLRAGQEELAELMSRLVPDEGTIEPLPGLLLNRSTMPVLWGGTLSQPAFCFVAQGSKRALVGADVYLYDPSHYLLFTVDLPVAFEVEEASEKDPFLGLRLNLKPSLVASVAMDFGIRVGKGVAGTKAINASAIDADLHDTVVRLIRLLEDPSEAKILGPVVIKEIVYRLLKGSQGARLGHMLAAEGDTNRISKAIGHMRDHFKEQLRIEKIAQRMGMSVSGFHNHFKSVTSMSPLQFQKNLRLQEARRLMLGENLDAATAGYQVGYEDPSHFSREYKKHFGAPPQRDIATLRENM